MDAESDEGFEEFTKPPFLYEGRDLVKEEVPQVPTIFGRQIARILFGDNGNCELITQMIEPDFTKNPNRVPADASKVQLLKSKAYRY